MKVQEMKADYSIDDVVQEYIKKVIMVEKQNFENQQKEKWEKRFTKNIKSSEISFQCAILRSTVNVPVVLRACLKENYHNPHFESYLDLKNLIIAAELMNSATISYNCPKCQAQIISKAESSFLGQYLTKDQLINRIKNLVVPNMLIFNLKQQLGINPIEIIYYYEQKTFFPKYYGKYEKYFNEHLLKEPYQLEPILLQKPIKNQQFCQIAFIKQETSDIEFPNICILSSIRINIPVRGKQCTHYEAYDLVALHKHILEKNNGAIMNCLQYQCESQFDISDPNSFQIDYELLMAGIKGFSFSITFYFNPNYQVLSDLLYLTQSDKTVLFYRDTKNTQKNLTYLHSIYSQTQQIFINQNNQQKTQEFYESFPSSKWKEFNFIKCSITNYGIQLPARCINCKELKVCDLRLFACILDQIKQDIDLDGVKQKMISCPLCGQIIKKKPKPPLKLLDQVYIDTKMMNFFNVTHFSERNISNFKEWFEHSKSHSSNMGLQEIHISQSQSLQFDQLDKLPLIEWEYGSKVSMYVLPLQCAINSSNKVRTPVRSYTCQLEHYQCFELNTLKNLVKQGVKLKDITCPLCFKQLGDVSNLFIDRKLSQLLSLKENEEGIKRFSKATVNWLSGKLGFYNG